MGSNDRTTAEARVAAVGAWKPSSGHEEASVSGALRVELHFPAEWGRIESIRAAVALCVRAAIGQQDLDDTMSMVVAELLENAVKYGLPSPSSVVFTLVDEGSQLVVTVTNLVPPGSQHIGALHDRLTWIDSFSHPSEAYLAALRQIYEETEERTSGGLGMVRVAYEGGCRIECDDSQLDRVVVRAIHARARRDVARPQ